MRVAQALLCEWFPHRISPHRLPGVQPISKARSMTPDEARAAIREWIDAVLDETGMSAETWAKRSGVSPSTIHRARGDDYKFVTTSRTLALLAGVANRPPPELNVSEPVKVAPHFLRVRYKLQAGHWLEIADMSQVEQKAPLPTIAPDARYSFADQWLEEVLDDSMDVKIANGSYAHVVDAADIAYMPETGHYVVVERISGGGLLRERSIKLIAVLPGGVIELRNHSTNPRWRGVVPFERASRADGSTMSIVGRVLGAYFAL